MLSLQKVGIYTALGTGGFILGNMLMKFANWALAFAPVKLSPMQSKVARGALMLIGGTWLLSQLQQGNLLVGAWIPDGYRGDDKFAALIGGWGPGVLLPLAQELGFPLANAGDIDKFYTALLSGQGLLSEDDMRGMRSALKLSLANAGRSDSDIQAFDGLSMVEIARHLDESIPDLQQTLRELQESQKAASQAQQAINNGTAVVVPG